MPSGAGAQVAAAARTWVGTPFVWEAMLKGVGADCRGVVTGAAREAGRPEAAEVEALVVGYSRRVNQVALVAGLDRLLDRKWHDRPLGQARLTLDQLAPGDVLAFRIQGRVQHLGIYTGGQGRHTMVHAYSGEPNQVVEVPLGRFWQARLAGVWRWRAMECQRGD